MLTFIGALSLLIWIYLLFARGGFWKIPSSHGSVLTSTKRVVAVVPARNEAAMIGEAVESLLAQVFHVVLVDDSSEDGTAEAAREAATQLNQQSRLTVIKAGALQPGWTGKLWALSRGVAEAEALKPDYLLFTDADISHGAESVSELVAMAEARDLDLCSYMVKLRCESFAEKALIPAFVYFFLQLYPPAWIASARHKTAGAAGGCILIPPAALQKIGGLAAIRGEIIDDCALARRVKRSGGKLWLGLTTDTESIRPYGGFTEIGGMISRSAFNQLHHSALLLVGTMIGMTVTYLLPPLLLVSGQRWAALLGGAAWLLMSVSYAPLVRFYRLPLIWAVALPAIALLYLGATVDSALRYWRGKGGEWKGRVQDT